MLVVFDAATLKQNLSFLSPCCCIEQTARGGADVADCEP